MSRLSPFRFKSSLFSSFWGAMLMGVPATVCADANDPIIGPETYPHYRGMSCLPGGGFGVLPNGDTSMDGAMSISTPIGFSLSNFHGDLGATSLSYDKSFTGINVLKRSTSFSSGGVADGMMGFSLGHFGSCTLSYELLSSVLDSSLNFQYQAPIGGSKYGVSAGVEDVENHSGAAGEAYSGALNKNSRSVFVAATALVAPKLYVTLGKGDRRFKNGVFGNASYGVTPRVKLVGEYDTYGWNYAVAYGFGNIPRLQVKGRSFEPILSVGYVNSQRAMIMLNVAF